MLRLELSALEIWRLRQLSTTAVGRVALRALMVLWRGEALTTREIGERLGCHRDTVSFWLERYQALGIPGLFDEPRPGRPRRLDAAAREQVEALLEQHPEDSSRPAACWTLSRLRAKVLTFVPQGCCLDTVRRTVHALGFRWRRPRLWAFKEDPESFEKLLLIETAKEHAAARAQGAPATGKAAIHLLYGDASDQSLLAVLRAMWMRVGQQVRVATPPRNGRWTLFGALNAFTGVFLWQAFGKPISATFIQFLEHLLTCYPEGMILLVVDNAAYHRSKAVVAWLKEHPRVLLLYLPVRRPDLNPIEAVWRQLKQHVSANRSFGGLLALGSYISEYFASLTPEDFLRQAGLRRDYSEAT